MCKTIKQKVRFKLSPKDIYALLTESGPHANLTGQRASISKKVGGNFSTRNGCVSGLIVDLAPEKRVVQAWRNKEFPEGIFSMATFHLSPTDSGGTEVVLTHRGVPKHLIPSVEKDWRKFYWEKIRKLAITQLRPRGHKSKNASALVARRL